MSIVCVGISHHTAPISVRERLALGAPSRRALATRLIELPQIREAVLLSTCNRTEVYVVGRSAEAARWAVSQQLLDVAGTEADEIETYLTAREGPDAVRHLLRVAAGLESMILGESQILGQVRDAADEARDVGTCGPVLDALFTSAVRAGRRARCETDIGVRAASVPSAAVELATQAAGPLARGVIVVIGAGEMGVLAAKALLKQGAHSVVVSNRSYDRAVELAREWDGCAVTFDRLVDAVSQADVIIASTGAPHPVLRKDDVERAMAARPDRPLAVVDIAVPRDVEPAVGDIEGVRLFDIDDLEATVSANLAQRAAELPEVEPILAEEEEAFIQWRDTLGVTPTIAALRRWADEVGSAELDRALRKLDDLDERDREIVKALAAGIIGKLLHPPTAHLRELAGDPEAEQMSDAVRSLFGLREAAGDGANPPDRRGEPSAADESETIERPAPTRTRAGGA